MTDDRLVPDLLARRTGAGTYTVRVSSGAELRISGDGSEGTFSPVELLQAALAGCAALSAEAQLTSQLGADFEASATVAGDYNPEEKRVEKLTTTITADMSDLTAEKRERLSTNAERMVDKLCVVKHSLETGVEPVTDVSD